MFEGCKSAVFKISPEGYQCCNSCGSMHPQEFVNLIKDGRAILSEIQWKSNSPYLFYVNLLNPNLGKTKQVGIRYYTEDGISKEEPILGKEQKYIFNCKLYIHHLLLIEPQTFTRIVPYINKITGIRFKINKDGFYYTAPCCNSLNNEN